MQNRILAICPTRERVYKCQKMLETFLETSTQADIYFIMDKCDPQLDQYEDLFMDYTEEKRIEISVLPRMSTTRIINGAFNNYPNYEFYHITNDDFVYETQDWDKKLIESIEAKGVGIAWGNDDYMRDKLPCSPIISGDIVRALGWLQLPDLECLFGDNVWKVIGAQLGKLCYRHDVKIRHEHPYANKEYEKDNTHLRTNSKEMINGDNMIFHEWLKRQSYEDAEKIKQRLINEIV